MYTNEFKIFLWKNWLCLKFYWFPTIIITAGCFGILVLHLKTTYSASTTPSYNYACKDYEALKTFFPANSEDYLYYSPSTPFIDNLMELVRNDLYMSPKRLKLFDNSSTMIEALEDKQKTNCFAVHFDKGLAKSKGPLSYSISSSMTKISPKKRFVNDDNVNAIIDNDEYTRTGFLTLQHAIDLNFIKSTTNDNTAFTIEISSLPSITFDSVDGQRINAFGTLFVFFFNILLLSITLIPLVEEKHDGIKVLTLTRETDVQKQEFLVLATPLNFLNGLTFFIIRFLVYLLFILGCIGVATTYHALGLVPLGYFIVLFLFYGVAAMCFTFLISVCFNSVFYAKVGGFLFLIIPYIFHLVDCKLSNIATKIFCTSTFLEAMNIFQLYTNKHRKFVFRDMFSNNANTKYNIFTILVYLLLQAVVYTILYNYLSCIFPGKGGLKQSLLFFLKPLFYHSKNPNQFIGDVDNSGDSAIVISGLKKKFSRKDRQIIIADDLNMTIKDCTITVLLGHNGAGKTTILNMLIGCVPKDSGNITVYNERDVAFYRHLIGYCPQHSVFMQYMTCLQHLKFFAELRGQPEDESMQLLNQLGLEDKANETGNNLSGGMKRRLSLGIALSGKTKLVILDEPSSGLDVESRRELWDTLLRLRKSKAILITTHHMEEAEILGDTISILSDGKLKLTGSPLELKRYSGSGYILKLRTDRLYKEKETSDIIKQHIPDAKIVNTGPQTIPPTFPQTISITMPYSSRSNYATVLNELEVKKESLGINSIMIKDTSLEDVYLNCNGTDHVDTASHIANEDQPEPANWLRQAYAVFYKKFIFIRRNLLYSYLMCSLPFLAISIATFVIMAMAKSPVEPGMNITLGNLKKGFIFLSNTTSDYIDILRNEIENIDGIHINYLPNNSSFEEAISEQKGNLYNYYEHAIGAIVLHPNKGNPNLRIYHSTNILHSSVIMVNLVDNAILKFLGHSNYSINATYMPIQRATDINPSSLEYFSAIVPIGFFIYMLFYVSLPFLENKTGFKSLQAIPRATYWISCVVFDMLLHTLICLACFGFQYAIIPSNLFTFGDQILLLFTYLFYGFWYLPILYCMAIGFRSISPLSTYLFFLFIVSSIVPFITSNNIESMKHFQIAISIMSLLPDFSFIHQLRLINDCLISDRRKVIKQSESNDEEDQPSSTTIFVYAVVFFFIVKIFLIVIWDNLRRINFLKVCIMCYSCKQKAQLSIAEDETQELNNKANDEEICNSSKDNNIKDYPLIVKQLDKFYGRLHAVRGISFQVKRKECFGLLGVNGAGKSSTFQMITASSPVSRGDIIIDGVSLLENETLYKYRFGYCPQGDCLNKFMTSYEMLKYMALLRNVRHADIHHEVISWLNRLGLSKYQNVGVRYYSGGTKRKLNAAMAMIGNPPLVLLDEPTTGVDPVSRRLLWKCIRDFQESGKTVVLTSHSMDECEYLCNRLAIMANGKLQCNGYIPDLKVEYGDGFTINIKLISDCAASKISEITSVLRKEFISCEIREQHAVMVTYFIGNTLMKWSEVFRKLECFMKTHEDLVEDYSVNETTLEDIFLKFEKQLRIVVQK